MRTPRRLLLAAALAAGTAGGLLPAGAARAASSGDITAAVLAGRDVVLGGDATVTVPSGSHIYNGVISGHGTLRVAGTGTLVLTRDSTFTLPTSRQHQRVSVLGGNHPYTRLTDPDSPAITVARGATLQYGTGGGTGLIGSFPYNTPGYAQNQDNIRVDGTLRFDLTRAANLGIISGSGLVVQPRNTWGTLQIAGTNPFSGIFDNGTGAAFAATTYPAALPNARTIVNQGSWIIDTPLGHTVVQRQVFYNLAYGSDVNVHTRPGSTVVLTGYYSWADRGGDTAPSLSSPSLNWQPVAHNLNVRGTNIEGADVHWGDGSTHQIFMPGTAQTVYINLHVASNRRSKLTFDYNAPVTLGAPIGGGRYHDTLGAPGQGDVVIAGTRGNDVTFAAAQYYNGSTTVERGGVLHLGSGKSGGDGRLWTGGALSATVDNGSLVVRNTRTDAELGRISGTGSLTQAGPATTTLNGPASYTGGTVVGAGTLVVHGTSLARSSGVTLSTAHSVLDLRGASTLTLRQLQAVKGAGLLVPTAGTLTVAGKAVKPTAKQTSVTIGRTAFAVTRSGSTTRLTATSTAPGTAAASASASAKATVSGSAAADGSATGSGSAAASSADAASAASESRSRPWALPTAAGVVAVVGLLAFLLLRNRRRPGLVTRGRGRRRASGPRG